MRGTKAAVIVPAAGRGTRFGSSGNKIWTLLRGRPLIEWTLAAVTSHPAVEQVVLVGSAEDLPRLVATAASFPAVAAVVEGGATRADSVRRGLESLPDSTGVALVHDAARPLVSPALIDRVIVGVLDVGAAAPGLPVCDSLKRVDAASQVVEAVDRERLYAVQTPQGARADRLREAYRLAGGRAGEFTDEAGLLTFAGFPVAIVEGDESNLKITRPADLFRAERELSGDHSAQPAIRTGFGYDVHAFAEGRPLWLGGVQIPHSRGLAGHSDADVLLHALCDALLGAAALGDIGVLFPDTDSAHKDRASIEFVEEVRFRLAREGWAIANVDVALLAEEPRIGPHRDQMTAAIARGLQIAPTQINIKATTSEKMGFVGRSEGIACWAVATIRESA